MPEHNESARKDVLTGHVYDGIMEYDNPTPGWWHLIWFGSIVFSVLYALVYHLSPIVPTHQQEVATALRRENDQKFGAIANLPMGDEKMLLLMRDQSWLDTGKNIFQGKCAICHGPEGAGLVGPNLTDDKYKNVRKLEDIYTVIRDGAGNGQMPAQKTVLNDNQIAVVAAYVASIRGQNKTSVRELPEEMPIDPWPSQPAVDPAESPGVSETGATGG
ncbi:MAG: cytochrome C oxidase Cbb3 [Leptolyngbya sp. PLA3]|nr:MAG: cytochrome C oxidase Cbb3 [Cyanobacteria bacterium CYA]MCE7968824.1 cytochrome C oxidase Cbb3 [Leptolyngbya sp. PL-A3]